MLRVCRNKAVVAVATSTAGQNNGRATFKGEATDNQDTSQILGLFDGHVKTVYFRHEAAPPEIMLVMAVFEIAKSQ